MLNLRPIKLPSLSLDASKPTQYVDLDPGIPTSGIYGRLYGTLTVPSTPTGDSAVRDDALQRLIPKIRIERDGNAMVRDVALRDMYQIYLRSIVQEPTQAIPVDTDFDAAGNVAFELHFGIPFVNGWLARPWDTHWPGFFVRNSLRAYFTFATDKVTTGSDAGTGALLSAGSDDITWATAPTLELYQRAHPRRGQGGQPAAIRHYSSYTTASFSAAQDPLTERIQSERQFDLHLFRMTSGSSNDLDDDLVDELSLKATGETWVDEMSLEAIRQMEAETFPAVNEESGYFAIRYAQDGLLTNAVRPADHPDLRYEIKTTAPDSGSGVFTITSAELIRSEGE